MLSLSSVCWFLLRKYILEWELAKIRLGDFSDLKKPSKSLLRGVDGVPFLKQVRINTLITHGQCDARPTVTCPNSLAGTKLYWLTTVRVWTTCLNAERPGVEPAIFESRVWPIYIVWSDVTQSVVTTRSPFCGYIWNNVWSLRSEDLSCYLNKSVHVINNLPTTRIKALSHSF